MTDQKSPPNPPSEAEILQAVEQDLTLQLMGLVGLFAPQLKPNQLPLFIKSMAKEQVYLAKELWPTLYTPETVQKMPTISVRIYQTEDGVAGSKPIKSTEFMCTVQKQFVNCTGDNRHVQSLATAMLITLILNPAVRCLLRIYGYHYDFVQHKPREESKIKLVK